MKAIDVKDNIYIDFGKEYQNTKTFLLKPILQIDLKKFL